MALPLIYFIRLVQGIVIEGKADGHSGCPHIIDQLIMVQKKSLRKIRDGGLTPYQSSGILTN